MDGRTHHDDDHDHRDGHEHGDERRGVLDKLLDAVAGHKHGVEGTVDRALETSDRGMTALKISLLGLAATAAFSQAFQIAAFLGLEICAQRVLSAGVTITPGTGVGNGTTGSDRRDRPPRCL